jgi:hypothetical protein
MYTTGHFRKIKTWISKLKLDPKTKALKKLGIEGSYLNIIQVIYI